MFRRKKKFAYTTVNVYVTRAQTHSIQRSRLKQLKAPHIYTFTYKYIILHLFIYILYIMCFRMKLCIFRLIRLFVCSCHLPICIRVYYMHKYVCVRVSALCNFIANIKSI